MRFDTGALTCLLSMAASSQHYGASAFTLPSNPSSVSSTVGTTIEPPSPRKHSWATSLLFEAATAVSNDETKEEKLIPSSVSGPLSQSVILDEARDGVLLRDIKRLTKILGSVVERDNPEVYDIFSRFVAHGVNRQKDVNDAEPLSKMIQCAKDLSNENALGVMRLFSIALNLVNSAEVHHRMRVLRELEREADRESQVGGPLPMTEDSMRGTIQILLDEGYSKDQIFDAMINQKVEIVLTAHPTEVSRRTMLEKYKQITEQLEVLDRKDLNPYMEEEAVGTLKRIVASIWGCDEIRRIKPTPQKEALGGIAIIESVLWDAVPSYFRKLDAQLRISVGDRLPIDSVPIKFASWIGGDRDGNPNVTPDVTVEIVNQQKLRAAKLYMKDLDELYGDLAISSKFSQEMIDLANTIENSKDNYELYRRVIGHLEKRFLKTIRECEIALQAKDSTFSSDHAVTAYNQVDLDSDEIQPITKSSDLIDPLMIMHRSLVETGFEEVADGLLVDIIRKFSTFGLTLVPLDIREESTRHTMALDAVTKHLGVGSYLEWDEQTRLNFLQTELSGKRPLFRTREIDQIGASDDVVKTLKCFEMASNLEPEALGAYVISQAQTASDVLAVMLLQKQFGMTADKGNMMRVSPLFETLDDLVNSSSVLETLFSIPAYTGAIAGKQEVMVGYSDSAKDAGRLAANWALYENQCKMEKVAQEHNIELTFFHGKGGTVGRGGNPALYRAILSHPPNTIDGRFRVTEQGEMITQNFGDQVVAERTLDIYTAAVLREKFTDHVKPTDEWIKQMERISESSCSSYRNLVREEPRFVPYFRQATPELELGLLNIGSRPAKRNPKGGIESLRAIPWTFAWTQTRTNLSAWLGVEAALTAAAGDIQTMTQMYEEWPWFRETIDLIGMILSKTDFSVSKNYDEQLVEKTEELTGLGKEIRDKMVVARKGFLSVTGRDEGEGPHVSLLRASTKVRGPYLDPINVIQAELLKRFRAFPVDESGMNETEIEQKNLIQDALKVSIKGVAQGMRNSG